MPSIEWNLGAWNDRHGWADSGDEWNGMAKACGQPYEQWKQALIDTFMRPYVHAGVDVLEIAPGHGRWSELLVPRARSVALVDLSPDCIATCRERFAAATNVTYATNDGRSLPTVADDSIDFIWSFDSFVHIDAGDIAAYLDEFRRVLRPGGHVVVHHAGRRNWTLPLLPVAGRLGTPGRVATRLASQGRLRDSGNRSAVSSALVLDLATRAGLDVLAQRRAWGPSDQYTVDKYRDVITVAKRPDA